MCEEQPRAKRATKKPAWLLDNVDPSSVEAEGVMKPALPIRQQPRRGVITATGLNFTDQQDPCRQQRLEMPRRMCLNPGCKNPFDSPQWRRGPLGPGTLCNACGTRYARIEVKRRGEKRGGSKLRPQDIAEWQAFEQQLQWPPDVRQAWAAKAAETARMAAERQQQQHCQEVSAQANHSPTGEYAVEVQQLRGDAGRWEQQASHSRQQQLPVRSPLQDDDEQLLCSEDIPQEGPARATAAAKAALQAALAAVGGSSGPLHSHIKQHQQYAHADVEQQGSSACHDSYLLEASIAARIAALRRRRRCDAEDGSDSQEAAACSYQEPAHNASSGSSRQAEQPGGSEAPGDQFLHLLAVGQAMIKAEGVAPKDRREAWAEYVEKRLPAEQCKATYVKSILAIGLKPSHTESDAEQQQAQQPEQPEQLPAPSKDRFEQLVAEAECAVRARSCSPLLRPRSPFNAAAVRPATAGVDGKDEQVPPYGGKASCHSTAMDDAVADRSPVPRSRLVVVARQQHVQPPGAMSPLMLPAAANVVAGGGDRVSAGGLLSNSVSSRPYEPHHKTAGSPSATASDSSGSPSSDDEQGQERQSSESPNSKLLRTTKLQLSAIDHQSLAAPEQQRKHVQQQQQPPQPHKPLQRLTEAHLKQQKQQLQQQYQILNMLGGLLHTALGVPESQADPAAHPSSCLHALLADPLTMKLLRACLEDEAASAWLKGFLSKVGIEHVALHQQVPQHLRSSNEAAAVHPQQAAEVRQQGQPQQGPSQGTTQLQRDTLQQQQQQPEELRLHTAKPEWVARLPGCPDEETQEQRKPQQLQMSHAASAALVGCCSNNSSSRAHLMSEQNTASPHDNKRQRLTVI